MVMSMITERRERIKEQSNKALGHIRQKVGEYTLEDYYTPAR